jgi:Domain of unknown function (DUF4139)
MNHHRFASTVLVLLAAGLPALGQPLSGKPELPISRIVLFSSGVGYFQRDGQAEGNTRVDLQFSASNVNDLLKSLILQDLGGGQISTVSYDNRDPIEKTLKSFAIDLTGNPSLGLLLNQLRGERVEVISFGEQGKQGSPVTLSGVVIGVQKVKKPVGKEQVIETEQLNLLTEEGVRGVELDQVQRIRFLRPELEREFRKALEVLATGHDKQKKTVSLNFLGTGKRPVRVGYVTEAPVWKTSYRLSLDKESKDAKVFLQGWAIVENTTDEDWTNTRLALVSGRPISFQMDLYQPLYLPRPVVEPELFTSLRPQTYGGDIQGAPAKSAAQRMGEAPAAAPGLGGRRPLGRAMNGFQRKEAGEEPEREALNLHQGVASAAVATELGDYFKYEIEQPINLPRQKSALIPIVNGPVEATRLSIYNEQAHAKFPLLGLRLKNSTALHLTQGPVTVFEGSSYAGDGRLSDMQPNETRLVSYAVDLGTEVAPEVPAPADHLVSVKIFKGILHATHKVRFRKIYTIKNRSDHERLVLVEHPYQPALTLVSPEKAAERTRDVYRFEVKAEPNKTAKLEVIEEQQRVDELAITNSEDDAIQLFVRASVASPKVKKALEDALELKQQVAKAEHEIRREEQALVVIEKDQSRIRANMERLPQTSASELLERYRKKLGDQENEIERGRQRITKLQQTVEEARQKYEVFVLGLNVE